MTEMSNENESAGEGPREGVERKVLEPERHREEQRKEDEEERWKQKTDNG